MKLFRALKMFVGAALMPVGMSLAETPPPVPIAFSVFTPRPVGKVVSGDTKLPYESDGIDNKTDNLEHEHKSANKGGVRRTQKKSAQNRTP